MVRVTYTKEQIESDAKKMIIGAIIAITGVVMGTQLKLVVYNTNLIEFVPVFIGMFLMAATLFNRMIETSVNKH